MVLPGDEGRANAAVGGRVEGEGEEGRLRLRNQMQAATVSVRMVVGICLISQSRLLWSWYARHCLVLTRSYLLCCWYATSGTDERYRAEKFREGLEKQKSDLIACKRTAASEARYQHLRYHPRLLLCEVRGQAGMLKPTPTTTLRAKLPTRSPERRVW